MTHDENTIVIVSGIPRCGTSMMMRMLEAGGAQILCDDVRSADEDNPLGYYEYEPVKATASDASWLSAARGKVVKAIYMLLYKLPPEFDYKVIFMRRKLSEVVDSQATMLERRGESGAKQTGAAMVGMYERQLQQWDDWVRQQENFTALNVDYNRIVADGEKDIEAVNQLLGGGLDTAAMQNVITPSLYRHRG